MALDPAAVVTAQPLSPREPLFRVCHGGGLAYGLRADEGVAVIAPLPLGVTLEGLEQAEGQRGFLEFVSGGTHLIAYDQRGSGLSGDSFAGCGPEALGEDLWAVARAAGVERAVLYGVLDAGQTAVEAARLQPDRVLGLIFNFTPPAFGRESGVSEDVLADWFSGPEQALAPREVLTDLGLSAGDIDALAKHWCEVPGSSRERLRLLRDVAPDVLETLEVPALILEPLRRRLFSGWGEALAAHCRQPRVVQTTRGAQALGAIDAFMMWRTSEEGQHASRLSPGQSRAFSAAAQSARELRVIVVPVDEQLASARAVDLACRLAEAQEATIVLASVQVVPRVRALDAPAPESVERAEQALRVAEAVAARRDARYSAQVFLARGYVDGVVRVAEQAGADLIVLPNPRSGLGSGLADEQLHELFSRAPCEVLIDRGRTHALPEDAAQ